MEIFANIIGWGWLWTLMGWRIMAAHACFKEIANGKTTQDAGGFLILQGVIYTIVSITFGKYISLNIFEIITEFMFTGTALTHFYFGIKSVVAAKRRKIISENKETSANDG